MNREDIIEMLEAEWRDRLKAAVLAEREACAKIVEESSLPDAYSQECMPDIANDIRARDYKQDGQCKRCTDGCPACDARKLPEQEPVAFVKGCNRGQWEIFPAKAYQIFEREQPLYTTPQPARQQEPVAWLHTKIEGVAVPHRPADLDRHPDRWEALYKTPQPCSTCEALARTVMLDQTGRDA